MIMKFICHPRCTTCKKARDFLDRRGITYEERDICLENPSREELSAWLDINGGDIRKMFNTSGIKYRELKLKDRIPEMSRDEALDLLATDGMLVKRPILVGDDFVLFGFREASWNEKL